MIIHVTDATHAGQARRHAAYLADEAKLGATEGGSLAIVVTEMATNLVKHAGAGTMVVESITDNGNSGVRVLALDKGPGIRDLSGALRDGYSTSGTSGSGLGAMKRLSHGFDIYTAPGIGTAVLSEFWPGRKISQHLSPIDVGVVSVPIKGEDVCGDGWGAKKTADSLLFMVVDGLGHGILAAEAAREAERIFALALSNSPTPILEDSHNSLKKTRGAAMAVSALQPDRQLVSFAGVGNIGASIVGTETSRGMASHNGTLGHHLHRIQEFSLPWNSDSILVMHSDGLKSGWDLQRYPGIWNKHPALIAGMLYRDFSRERDDVTVLIAKNRSEASST
ncbi:MAG TPA: ATP-binding SpoIIE family protein phosphatase [Candidatus Aquilonibacter sp.]|nr:ATP-binding SpoIIE family protein phosphatase [Candidatus Aquilonibacter sp.]